ncbi:hypothetical protein FF011L_00320 [Roseimaritima multifibrata]|uniref:Uncharacterized protein n=1 Tax=Roseimaritima multifibrata TaxID=1930274 RepID=A0A517M8U4_9BACT|nr:hypothetical protein FF011L_00320 [Roseimaritima multifibrata]
MPRTRFAPIDRLLIADTLCVSSPTDSGSTGSIRAVDLPSPLSDTYDDATFRAWLRAAPPSRLTNTARSRA